MLKHSPHRLTIIRSCIAMVDIITTILVAVSTIVKSCPQPQNKQRVNLAEFCP